MDGLFFEAVGHFLYDGPHNPRYIHDEMTKEFLDAVRKTCEARAVILKKGSVLWRSQIGHGWKTRKVANGQPRKLWERVPFGSRRMKPFADQAIEGRVNPKGIPCLYLSLDKNTAMAEARPWPGSILTLAKFSVVKTVRLVDCSLDDESWLESPDFEKAAWSDINEAFARPVVPSDNVADYVPTQILAELFSEAGYDGIKYRSSIHKPGCNIALFNLRHARFHQASLQRTTRVTFQFRQEQTR